jgi:NodT family efflux transporter outer membrane factor (OMF) lipoprotein
MTRRPRRLPARCGRLANSALGLGAAFALAACSVGPDYVRPSAAVAPNYKEAPPASAPGPGDVRWTPARPGTPAARQAWWQVYGDAQLDALEVQVAPANQNVAAAAARYRSARALIAQYRSALFPTVSLGAAFNQTRISQNVLYKSSAGVTVPDYVLGAQVSWEPDLWGRISRSVEGAEAAAQASAADLQGALLSMQAELATDYFQLRGIKQEEQLLTSTVQTYQQAVDLTRDRYQGGVAPESDLTQAEAQLRETQAQALDVGVTRAQLEHAIAILIGQSPSTFTPQAGPLGQANDPAPSAALAAVPLSVPSLLLERRPDIAAAERRVSAANARVGVATAAFFPNLMLTLTGGLESTNFGPWLAAPSRYWSLGPQLAGTILDFGGRAATRDQARASYDESVAIYRETVLTAFQQVEDNLAALRILETEAQTQQAAVTAAERSLSLVTNRYENGAITYLNVVVAQTTALSDERAAVAIARRRLTASVGLVEALGGGWSVAQLEAKPADK